MTGINEKLDTVTKQLADVTERLDKMTAEKAEKVNKLMTMAITLSLLGAFVALEAVVALVVGNDRRGVTTLSRILRILCGGYLIFVAVLGWYPSVIISVKMSLGSWNNLLQTFVNALVMGAALFCLQDTWVGLLSGVEKNNRGGKKWQAKIRYL